jgi:hypothetical protein
MRKKAETKAVQFLAKVMLAKVMLAKAKAEVVAMVLFVGEVMRRTKEKAKVMARHRHRHRVGLSRGGLIELDGSTSAQILWS